MKKYLTACAIGIMALPACAQEVILSTPGDKSREIGLIGESVINSSGNDDMSMIGLQFKKWKTEHLGYRIMAAYGEYNYRSDRNDISQIAGDTFTHKSPFTRADMAVVGLGLEAQRQFYKKVYFFAAAEIKGGYGTGDVDTLISRTYKENNGITTSGTNTGPKQEANVFLLGISPTIGAKFQFRHVSFGAEMVSNMFSYKSISYKNAATVGLTEMDLADISTRVFFSYKF